jgi:hypothetical protein
MEYSAIFLSGLQRADLTSSSKDGRPRSISNAPPLACPDQAQNSASAPSSGSLADPPRHKSVRVRRPRTAPMRPLFILAEEGTEIASPSVDMTGPQAVTHIPGQILRPRSYTASLPPLTPPPTGPLPSPSSSLGSTQVQGKRSAPHTSDSTGHTHLSSKTHLASALPAACANANARGPSARSDT